MQFADRTLDLSEPKVMGILNVTPDSFYDGGRYSAQGADTSKALARAELMVQQGASFIDVGGESTRPGAQRVTVEEELNRVLPVVEALAKNIDAVISVDTSSPEVMLAAYELGAGLINDVRALQKKDALTAAKKTKLPICLMHMQGSPDSMQDRPQYSSVIDEVSEFFSERIEACRSVGINQSQILLDPGFGFGKSDEHNITLLKNLKKFEALSSPLLVGLSRKSILGRLTGRKADQRLAGSLALAQYALQYGAKILRVHDVAETIDVVTLYNRISQE